MTGPNGTESNQTRKRKAQVRKIGIFRYVNLAKGISTMRGGGHEHARKEPPRAGQSASASRAMAAA